MLARGNLRLSRAELHRAEGARVGVVIAPGVQINTATHPVELAERLNPAWEPGSSAYFWRTRALPVVIEDGCWIGAGCILLGGVTVGRGSVIGAGSVVTRDVPADCVAAGAPCRVIRRINGASESVAGEPR